MPEPAGTQHQFACPSCGAALEFAPGTAGLTCPYCGATLDIDAPAAGSAKLDFVAYSGEARTPVVDLPPFSLSCRNCGNAQQTTAIAGRCSSCRGPIVVSDDLGGQLKGPDGVVPFVVDQANAVAAFKQWVSSRWFAPTKLKKVGTTESMRGTYLPHWGFDDRTTTDYTGRRGEHYYTTESYTTQENGQTVTRTRQVQHTRWYPASGRVSRDFVDVLEPAVNQPDRETLDKLGPWSSAAATGYEAQYLAGFDTPRYDVEAEQGFGAARQYMASVIEGDCRSDIGGDEQQVSAMQTYDTDVLFRLLLLPLWVATYVLGGAVFDVYVNANTGKVIGERPYSWVKITAAVIAVLVVTATLVFVYQSNR